MGALLWMAQGLLAVIFTVSGVLKATWSSPICWPAVRPAWWAWTFGSSGSSLYASWRERWELIAPEALAATPTLTAIAAIGLGLIMVLAARVHWALGEARNVAVNLALLALCVFVAAGRLA